MTNKEPLKFEQLKNAYPPISISGLQIVKEPLNPKQLLKAFLPILIIL